MIDEYRELLPTNEDLRGAALALVRLTDTYMLNMSDISQGNIFGLQTRVYLSGEHRKNSLSYFHQFDWNGNEIVFNSWPGLQSGCLNIAP